jgi:hypothetical protein
MTSKYSSDELLDLMFSELIKRLTGFDPDYDAKVVTSLSETCKIPKRKILAKMQTYCHPGPRTLN